MIQSVIVDVLEFGEVVESGDVGDIERAAFELLGELDELTQTAGFGANDAFKRALLEKAGFLVGIAQGLGSDSSGWLEAFGKGLRDAAEMLAQPSSASTHEAIPALDA